MNGEAEAFWLFAYRFLATLAQARTSAETWRPDKCFVTRYATRGHKTIAGISLSY